ncbi:glycosyltransferase [Paenibacillus sp. FSL R5-0876]|uniref:glycosyltransferase n=1 Tax=Paenibacillus sp. FSL R5-0876 TaxID=2921661 RepID=UPI0030F6A72D
MNIAVVLNYNDYETTYKYITKIKNYSSLDKIVIVDNCSSDNSYSLLKELKSEKVDVISTERNNGYASGNNFGIKHIERYYSPKNIIISNPDIEVSEKSIMNICEFLNTHRNVAAASGLIHDVNNNIVKNFAWKLPSYRNVLINSFLLSSKIFEKVFNISITYDIRTLSDKTKMYVEVLSGCFFVIKSNVLSEINYFDESTFLYCEENILAHKINEKNYKQCILCDEKIIHYQGVTISKNIKSWRQKNKIIENSYKVYIENYLKVTKFKKTLYISLFNLGKYEKFFLLKLREMIK